MDDNRIEGDARNILGKAEDCVRGSVESVQGHINDKPVQSTLIALGVGLLIGRFFSL